MVVCKKMTPSMSWSTVCSYARQQIQAQSSNRRCGAGIQTPFFLTESFQRCGDRVDLSGAKIAEERGRVHGRDYMVHPREGELYRTIYNGRYDKERQPVSCQSDMLAR